MYEVRYQINKVQSFATEELRDAFCEMMQRDPSLYNIIGVRQTEDPPPMPLGGESRPEGWPVSYTEAELRSLGLAPLAEVRNRRRAERVERATALWAALEEFGGELKQMDYCTGIHREAADHLQEARVQVMLALGVLRTVPLEKSAAELAAELRAERSDNDE